MKEINTVKALVEDKDLSKYITEDLEDFDETEVVTYEIWAIGYDADGNVTDADMLIDAFSDPDAAVEKAKTITAADIIHQAAEEYDGSELVTDVAYVSIEVETVLTDGEDGTMNVGTIYKRDLWLDGEYGDEEDFQESAEDQEDEYSEVIPVTSKDYKLLEDGSLEISCDILKDYNKNDTVQIWFVDEDNKAIITYKIISKTTANKYICEFIY
jgi:hypothetical protein